MNKRPPLRRSAPVEQENDGIIEGRNAVTEALRAGVTIDKIFIARGETDAALEQLAKEGKAHLSAMDDAAAIKVMEEANQALCDLVQEANDDLLATTLFNRSLAMRNAFGSNDH